MKKRILQITSALLAVILVVVAFAACGDKKTDDTSDSGKAKSDLKVGIVCSAAGKNDTGYNKSAIEAAEKVAAELGAEVKVVEIGDSGVAGPLETMASSGFNLIFSLEYDFDALIKGVQGAKPIAEQFPDTHFVIFNDNPNVDAQGQPLFKNVTSVLFNVNEASYLAGYLAVQLNENQEKLFPESHKLTPLDKGRGIGFIGGTESNGITVFSYGYMSGINAAAEEYKVDYDYYANYSAGFTDPATGSTLAGKMYDQGVNVVFANCGVVGDGITSRAKEVGKLAIQTDADLDAQYPGNIITSVLKITGVPVEKIMRAKANGSLDGMDRLQNYDMASGAAGITDLSVIGKHVADQALWEEIKAKVNTQKEKIMSGEIKVVNAQIGEKLDPANCPRVHQK